MISFFPVLVSATPPAFPPQAPACSSYQALYPCLQLHWRAQYNTCQAALHISSIFLLSGLHGKKPFHGTSFKIFLGSETRREEICQGSSSELLVLLAPPTTQSSSLPPLVLEEFLHPPQSISLCRVLWFLHISPCLNRNMLQSLTLPQISAGHPQEQTWTSLWSKPTLKSQ